LTSQHQISVWTPLSRSGFLFRLQPQPKYDRSSCRLPLPLPHPLFLVLRRISVLTFSHIPAS
jgi:hypothetical protein